MKKYKNELNDALRRNRDIGEVKKHEYSEVEKEKNKFKKINSELKIIIQKQSKLVEVLRKKCAHLGMHFNSLFVRFSRNYIYCIVKYVISHGRLKMQKKRSSKGTRVYRGRIYESARLAK